MPPADLSEWQAVVDGLDKVQGEVDIAMVGKYVDLTESYKSLNEALVHAGIKSARHVNIHYIDSEQSGDGGIDVLRGMDAILVPGGFGERVSRARSLPRVCAGEQRSLPRICLGMQVGGDRIRPQ